MRSVCGVSRLHHGRSVYGVAPVLHLAQPVPVSVPLPVSQTSGPKLQHILPAEKRRYPDWDLQRIKDSAEKLRAYIRENIPELEQEVDKIAVARKLPPNVVEAMKKFARGEKLTLDDLEGELPLLLKDIREEDALVSQGFSSPEFDWDREYTDAIDREIVEEKRLRWENVAKLQLQSVSTDEEILKPTLDDLVDNGITLQRTALAFNHMAQFLRKYKSGELSLTQFMDWWPFVRDDAQASTWHGETFVGAGKSISRSDPDAGKRTPPKHVTDWTHREFLLAERQQSTLEVPDVLTIPDVYYHKPSEKGKAPDVVAEDDEPWFHELDIEKEARDKKSGKKDDHH